MRVIPLNQPSNSKPPNASPASPSDSGGKQRFQIATESMFLPERADSVTAPIATSHSRSGFDPQLTLSCQRNGLVGSICGLSLPKIRRKTEKTGPTFGRFLTAAGCPSVALLYYKPLKFESLSHDHTLNSEFNDRRQFTDVESQIVHAQSGAYR